MALPAVSVSIIVPVYNSEKYIEQTIKSVLEQTYTDWEMILVDDCSTDGSVEIIKSFRDVRIKLLTNKKNVGAAISRNIALKVANGKWIAFLDSDDLWDRQKLERQVNFMVKNDYHFSYTMYKEIDEQSKPLGKVVGGPAVLNRTRIRNYCYPGCLTVMYDATTVGIIQIEDLAKNNDYAMWIKVIEKHQCHLLPEVLASYRIREGSISSSSYLRLIKYHYLLWRVGEKETPIAALILTVRNLIFGIYKKIKYVASGGAEDVR